MVRISLLLSISFLVMACQPPVGDLPSLSFVLKPGIGRVEAVWTPVPGAQRYRVDWTTGSSSSPGGSLETEEGSATADGLVPGVDYLVTLTALSPEAPLARTTRHWESGGWTWVSDPVVLSTIEQTDAQAFDLGDGNFVIFLTTTTTTYEKLERLSYDSMGLVRTSWLRITKTAAKTAPTSTIQHETAVAGQWNQTWAGFTAGTTEQTTFAADRSTFTLASAPGVTWRLSRSGSPGP